jgi:hypothetical protein
MRVAIVGSFYRSGNPDLSQYAADQLEEQGVDITKIGPGMARWDRIKEINKVDVVYAINHSCSWRFFALAKLLGKKTVNHWIGTDVLCVLTDKRYRWKAKIASLFLDKHLAIAPHLVQELGSIGILAEEIPLVRQPIPNTLRPPDPIELRALAYLPDEWEEFYGASVVYQLAQQFPQVQFLIVGATRKRQTNLPNVSSLGLVPDVDMNKVYRMAPILIRVTQHDGLPAMVLEALANGDQVIYSYGFPYCYRARNFEEAAACLTEIIANGCPINYEGRRYVIENYDRQIASKRLLAALSTA